MENNPQPTTTQDGKKKAIIWSMRPKPEFTEFFNQLVTEKGSVQLALEHCIRLAMNPSKPAPGPAPAPAPAPKPVPADAIAFTDAEKTVLQKVERKKKVSQREALTHCIMYTGKNDWL